MKIILYIIIFLAAVTGILYLAGLFIPVKHVASRSVIIKAPIDSVWATITDIPGQTTWRPGLKKIEIVSAPGDSLTWIEHPRTGQSLKLREKNKIPPTRYEIEIVPDGPFSGYWIGELIETPEGVKFVSTEIGEIHNPIFRTLAYLFFDLEATITEYQRDLKEYLESGTDTQ